MKHVCHATGCNVPVPPAMLMCRKHWFMVPKPIQNEVWRAYRPGQEVTKDPSEDYMRAYQRAVASVEQREGRQASFPGVLTEAPQGGGA
jgi:hypothetical protein